MFLLSKTSPDIKFKKEWEEKLSNRSAGIVLARDRPEGFKKAAKPMYSNVLLHCPAPRRGAPPHVA